MKRKTSSTLSNILPAVLLRRKAKSMRVLRKAKAIGKIVNQMWVTQIRTKAKNKKEFES